MGCLKLTYEPEFCFSLAQDQEKPLARGKKRLSTYKYKYNGKELQEELGLNVTAMDYRQYDMAVGRFNSIDVLTETMPWINPYHFGYNNPVFWSDPSGLISQNAIDAMWNNSGNNAITTWTNDGNGNFDNSNGTGYVNRDGEYNNYTETLPQVTIYQGLGDRSNGDIIRGHVYQTSKYYKHWRNKESSKQWDEFQEGLDWFGTVPVLGEPIDLINTAISAVRGNYGQATLSAAAMIPFVGWGATAIKQSHHVIPKAVYKEFANDLVGIIKKNGVDNLMDLPVPFHGNHPQYSTYVKNALQNLKDKANITPASIEALQGQLRGMIDDALQSGQKLNDYFRP
jgi:RHS repeat-associated protein